MATTKKKKDQTPVFYAHVEIVPELIVDDDEGDTWYISLKYNIAKDAGDFDNNAISVMNDRLYYWNNDDEGGWVSCDEPIQKAYRDYIVEQELLVK